MSTEHLYETGVLPADWNLYLESVSNSVGGDLGTFYQSLIPGSKSLKETQFVALDFETTGMEPMIDTIVSIGLVPFTLDKIDLSGARYWLLKPEKLTEDSIRIHRITHQEVSEAPPFEEIIFDVLKHLSARQVVVHYRFMEREFFRHSLYKALEEILVFPLIDTLEIEVSKLQVEQTAIQKILKKRLPSVRLPHARARYALPNYENHNALTDALATAELLVAQVAHLGIADRKLESMWR